MREKKINPDCLCTWPGCPRHGDCQACKGYHHARDEKTACEKKKFEQVLFVQSD